MASCVPITEEKVRAEIWMGDVLLAKTPFVQNFNVNKSRSQISSTFSTTFELLGGTVFPLGEKLVIKAGTRGNLKTIMVGIIETTQVSPVFGKPSYFSITLGGRGVLSVLENKKFSRRLKSSGQGVFCLIKGGSGNRPQAYYSLDKTVSSGNHTIISNSPNPATRGGEQSPLVVNKESGSNQATGGYTSRLARQPQGGDSQAGGQGSFRTHTHENEEQGGPAFGVYSAD